ncbi:MAG TPA: hypothetical protein IAB37_05030 [Candidatus Faecivivens stercoravium]|uniref:Uncharacterized protein n=1 Tax=Candidatus Faecivivens stercoravium TaxID=2840803 RepID=A0A9D1J4N1_9FIRM|nr:hypothetical protein [Candidatus Faecivivens stercoravium]
MALRAVMSALRACDDVPLRGTLRMEMLRISPLKKAFRKGLRVKYRIHFSESFFK